MLTERIERREFWREREAGAAEPAAAVLEVLELVRWWRGKPWWRIGEVPEGVRGGALVGSSAMAEVQAGGLCVCWARRAASSRVRRLTWRGGVS